MTGDDLGEKGKRRIEGRGMVCWAEYMRGIRQKNEKGK